MSIRAQLSLAVVLTALALPATAAASAPPAIVPPVDGLYNHLGTRWWQYMMAQPASNNPLTDPTGANCRTGQSGTVFFLAGTWNTSTADRTQCTVPFGHPLFFPLINAFDTHVPGFDELTTPEKAWVDMNFHAASMNATVDGVKVSNLDPATSPYRGCAGPPDLAPGCAPPFTVTLPADNLFTIIGFAVPAGSYYPTVADGFYLLLAPPTLGTHTISFGGSTSGGFTTQTTYQLRVTRN